ncbi:YMGG-like glycine zipper-containing protein [Cupriavidus basilensis]
MNGMNRRRVYAVAVATLSLGLAQAKPIIYPAKGQSAEQQQKDDGQCYVWAKNSTGVDPAAVAAAPPSGPAGGGERVRGAARGAAGGAAIGAIAGDAGKGAAAGAVAGTMAGGARARRNQQAAQQPAQGSMDTYNRAYAACMEGRGYTVK